jgi:hypothetical protein
LLLTASPASAFQPINAARTTTHEIMEMRCSLGSSRFINRQIDPAEEITTRVLADRLGDKPAMSND